MNIDSVVFVKSVAKVKDCPEPLAEVAVIGRSNVGKSTLINMLMGRTVAKASDKPGKTQLINYFLVNDKRYFVDLPGYGYAKSSLEERRKWIDETYTYFMKRKPFILLLVDGSIPPQKIDLEFMQELEQEGLEFVVILTKVDKASQKEVSKNLKVLKGELSKYLQYIPEIIISSSVKKMGREKILNIIEEVI